MSMCPYVFEEALGDARLAELRLLSWANQHPHLEVGGQPTAAWTDLLISLVADGLLTTFSYERGKQLLSAEGLGSSPSMIQAGHRPGESYLDRAIAYARITALDGLYQGHGGMFRLTHNGRVRLSELKQALRTGREREPLGILWDVRHWEQDLQIALIDASDKAPLSVVYLDLNGLKALNDKHGHDAGDAGLRAYFQSVVSVLGDTGQAYRLGGDEVLVYLPGRTAAAATATIEAASRRLMAEHISVKNDVTCLSIAAGIACQTGSGRMASDVRAAADTVQYRAKEASRTYQPRASVIAIDGVEQLTVIQPPTPSAPRQQSSAPKTKSR